MNLADLVAERFLAGRQTIAVAHSAEREKTFSF
jgi:hypothetical protein